MSKRRVNEKRLIALVQWAAGEDVLRRLGLPSHWEQYDWVTRRDGLDCGTACCIAGKVALEDGGKPASTDDDPDDWVSWADNGDTADFALMPNGKTVRIEDYATEALGLDADTAMELFESTNSVTDLIRITHEILAAD